MELMELLMTRRTYRRFEQNHPIPPHVLEDILQAARLASSACNLQPLHYLVIQSPQKTEQIFPMTHWAALLPKDTGTPKDGEHPVLFILVLYDKVHHHKWIDIDAGLAISNMTLAAWNHGVGSCIMDNIDREGIRSALHLSEETQIHSLVAFGYPRHQSHIVPVTENGNTRYFLDEQKDYYVPKRMLADIVTYL